MKATRTIIAMVLLLSGCGSCQRGEQPAGSSGGGAAAPAQPAAAPAPITPGAKIHVAPMEATVTKQEAQKALPAEGNVPVTPENPPGGAVAGAPTEPEGHDEGDCIVIADANPDYGPPPLAVAFSAEAECASGQPTYSWNFGEGTATSNDANPSHTYTLSGEFTATVTVTGPGGSTATDEVDITVEEVEPEPE
jgi:PKD repeat protein